MSIQQEFKLDVWLVNPASNEIKAGDKTTRISHISMQLLIFLAQNSQQDLSKSEILEAVWGTETQNEEVLTVAISNLRKALGDSAKTPRFIKTIPRYGYKMLVEIMPADKKISELPMMDPLVPANIDKQNKTGIWFFIEKVGANRFTIYALIAFLFLIILLQILVEVIFALKR